MRDAVRYTSLGCGLVALFCLPLIFGVPNPYGYILLNQINDWCHCLLFFAVQPLCYLIVRDFSRQFKFGKSNYTFLLVSSLLSLFVGIAIEGIQSRIARDASWGDVARDGLGIVMADGVIIAATRDFVSLRMKIGGALIALVALVASLVPVAPWLYAQALRNHAFPELNNFENVYLNKYVFASAGAKVEIVPAPADWPGNHSQVAKLTLPSDKKYPGLQLINVEPLWKNYSTLSFDALSQSDNTEILAVNVYSIEGLRQPALHFKFEITPSVRSYTMPLAALSDQHITDIIWHSLNAEHSFVLYLDNIRLE